MSNRETRQGWVVRREEGAERERKRREREGEKGLGRAWRMDG